MLNIFLKNRTHFFSFEILIFILFLGSIAHAGDDLIEKYSIVEKWIEKKYSVESVSKRLQKNLLQKIKQSNASYKEKYTRLYLNFPHAFGGSSIVEVAKAEAVGAIFSEDKKVLIRCPENIEKFTIPSTVTTIGDRAFDYNHNLKEVIIPDSVTSIGDNAFQVCLSLHTIKIPPSVKTIGKNAFKDCRSLREVKLANGIKRIGDYAFFGTDLEHIVIPDSVTEIGESAFMCCKNLKSVIILGVTKIGKYAFSSCSNLSEVKLPTGLGKISEGMFSGCSALKSLEIPHGVIIIERRAFYESGIESISVPDTLRVIYTEAFWNCSWLKEIKLPTFCRYQTYAFPGGVRILEQ